MRNDLLRHNVKFIFEGEEEIGSPSLAAFLTAHRELLRSDVILVSDTSMLAPELPSLTTGLRGLAYWQIEVTGPNRDLHSGHFGGAVANPALVLCELLAKMVDSDGRITIPGSTTMWKSSRPKNEPCSLPFLSTKRPTNARSACASCAARKAIPP